MLDLYYSDKEYQQHSQAIHAIAEQYHINEDLVKELYEDELRKLKITAKLKQYLSVLVVRHVKEILLNVANINNQIFI